MSDLEKLIRDVEALRHGEQLRFSEPAFHDRFGVPISDHAKLNQSLSKQFAIDAIANGDMQSAEEFADIYYTDECIFGGTTIRNTLESFFENWEIDKQEMVITFSGPRPNSEEQD